MDSKSELERNLKEGFEQIKAPPFLKEKAFSYVHHLQQPPKKTNRRGWFPMVSTVAICLLLVFCGIGGYSVYSTETAYISIDINPSMELGLNRFDRIISQTAYNDDGNSLFEKVDLKNKSYEEGLNTLLSDPEFSTYLSGNDILSFTVISDDTTQKATLLRGVESYTDRTAAPVECHGANTQLRNEASNSGMSTGKYRAYLELNSLDSSITIEDCHNMSMGEIRNTIEQCHNRRALNSTDNNDNVVNSTPDDGSSNHYRNDGCKNGNGSGYGNGHHGSGHE